MCLPAYTDIPTEALKIAPVQFETRQSEPAYVCTTGFIVLPCVDLLMAIVQTREMRKEADVRQAISNVSTLNLNRISNAQQWVFEFFEIILRNHHLFKYADTRVIAALAVMLTVLFRENLVGNEKDVLRSFNAPPLKTGEFMQLFSHARDNIIDLAFETALDDFIDDAPTRIQLKFSVCNGEVRATTTRIWSAFIQRGPYRRMMQWEHRFRILARCVYHSMAFHRISYEFDKVLERLKLKPNAIADPQIKTSFDTFVAGTNWKKPVRPRRTIKK